MDHFKLSYLINFKYFWLDPFSQSRRAREASKQGVQLQGESVSAADTI